MLVTTQDRHVSELKFQNKKLSDNSSEINKVNANLLKMVDNFQKNEKTDKAALSSHPAENAELAKSGEHLQSLLTESHGWAEPQSCFIANENNAAYIFVQSARWVTQLVNRCSSLTVWMGFE